MWKAYAVVHHRIYSCMFQYILTFSRIVWPGLDLAHIIRVVFFGAVAQQMRIPLQIRIFIVACP